MDAASVNELPSRAVGEIPASCVDFRPTIFRCSPDMDAVPKALLKFDKQKAQKW